MKLSDYIVEFLKENGVTTIFGYQGGAITHFVEPMNVQRSEINHGELIGFYESEEYKSEIKKRVNIEDVSRLMDLIKKSKRPVILAGGGIRLAKAEEYLEKLIEITGIPVVSTLMGIDSVNHEHKCFVGYMGSLWD